LAELHSRLAARTSNIAKKGVFQPHAWVCGTTDAMNKAWSWLWQLRNFFDLQKTQ
jgi:hypothetical protein